MTRNDNLKIVIVIASTLGIGQAANRAAVLGSGLAKHVDGMMGEDLLTKDGKELLGITQIPIPILSARPEISFLALANGSKELNCQVIFYLSRAQGLRSYDEYKESISETEFKDLDIDAIAIWGDPKSVTKLTGNLPVLR